MSTATSSRFAVEGPEIRKNILAIIKSHRAIVNPDAMKLLTVSATLFQSPEERLQFLQTVIMNARMTTDRAINLRSASESISAVIPSLQTKRLLPMPALATLQGLAAGTTTAESLASQTQQQGNSNDNNNNNNLSTARSAGGAQTQQQQAFFASHNANFRVVAADEMPIVNIDEATCASFRLTRAHRASTLKGIAQEAERVRTQQQGTVITADSTNLEALFTQKSDISARTIALRTRLALAMGRVLRDTDQYQSNSLLRGVSKNSNNSATNNNNNHLNQDSALGHGKLTVYRTSALDGLKLGQRIAIVGLLRFAPWLVSVISSQIGASNDSLISSLKRSQQSNNNNNQSHNVFSKGWLLEDFTGTIPLEIPTSNLSDICGANTLIGDGSIAVIHGTWAGKSVKVERIVLPPGETREEIKSQVGSIEDFFGAQPSDMHAANQSFKDSQANVGILVSDVKISIASNAAKLLRLIQEFENRSGDMDVSKVTFVLVGDFVATVDRSSADSTVASPLLNLGKNQNSANTSNSTVGTALDVSYLGQDRASINIAYDLESLGNDVIQRLDAPTPATTLTQTLRDFALQVAALCPLVAAKSEFILVPGPNDCCATAAGVYPRAPLLAQAIAAFAEKCPRTSAATNPCRLRFHTQEYVVCRAPLHRTFAASSMMTIEGKSAAESAVMEENNRNNNNRNKGKNNNKDAAMNNVDGGDDDEENGNNNGKKEPFAELAEIVVRGGFWLPVPSEGVVSNASNLNQQHQTSNTNNRVQQDTSASGGAMTVQLQKSVVTTNNNSASTQQPLLLRSWGGVRWTLDRTLYHGGAPHHPHMSFMCDDTSCWSCDVDSVVCANPGSFAVNGIFAWISPTDKTVDFNELPTA